MAMFTKDPVDPSSLGQTVWMNIKDHLVTADTVEVVKTGVVGGKTRFALRVWTGIRKDGSNGTGASEANEY